MIDEERERKRERERERQKEGERELEREREREDTFVMVSRMFSRSFYIHQNILLVRYIDSKERHFHRHRQ